jgi:hypothetical protein
MSLSGAPTRAGWMAATGAAMTDKGCFSDICWEIAPASKRPGIAAGPLAIAG